MNTLKLKGILTAAILALITSFSFASGVPAVTIELSEKQDATAIDVHVEGESAPLQVIIYNQNREEVLSEMITPRTDWTKRYRMDRLENGLYGLTVNGEYQKVIQHFEVKNGDVKLLKSETYYTPFIRENAATQTVDIDLLNPTKTAVEILVFDQDNRLVARKKYDAETTIHERFNFSDAVTARNDYQIMVRTANDSHSYTIDWK